MATARRYGRRQLLALGLLVPVAGACTDREDRPTGELRIATGSTTAVYYKYGQALAELIRRELPGLRPTVVETAASVANMRMVGTGEAEVGFTQADAAADVARTTDRVRALAKLYDDHLHLVVRNGSRINAAKDLKGLRVSLGADGSGTALTAGRLVRAAGLNPARDLRLERLGLDRSVELLRAGYLDAFFFSGGLPVAAIAGLPPHVPIRLVDLREHVKHLRNGYGEFYAERVIPGSHYDTEPVTTLGTPNYLVVSVDMPEPTAYALTKVLIEGRDTLAAAHPVGDKLIPRSAINTFPLPLHPGAALFYQERKGVARRTRR